VEINGMSDGIIPIGCDAHIRWDQLRDARSGGTYLEDAAVTCTLKNGPGEYGQALDGAQNLAMAYIAGSRGRYEGVVPKAVTESVVEGAEYYLELSATRGESTARREIRLVARYVGAHA
jgi:hypothetical protein